MVLRRYAPDFFERGYAFEGFLNSHRSQSFHAFGDRLIFDHRGRRAFDDQSADRLAHRQCFNQRRPSEITAAFAAVASRSMVENGALFSVSPSFSINSGSGTNSSLQFVQMRRTSRCAHAIRIELEIKNGSIPMSSRRVMAPAASFV